MLFVASRIASLVIRLGMNCNSILVQTLNRGQQANARSHYQGDMFSGKTFHYQLGGRLSREELGQKPNLAEKYTEVVSNMDRLIHLDRRL